MRRNSLLASLRFLTVLPLPAAGPRVDLHPGRTTAVFPLAGLVIGLLLMPLAYLPVAPFLRAAFLLTAWIALTGGFHEDAWIDAMDAALAPVDRQRRLEILKDPKVGAHGLTAALCLALLRYGALISVPPAAVIVAPVVGRWAMVASLRFFPPLRDQGLGAMFASGARPLAATLLAGAILLAVVTIAESAWPAVAWMVGAAAALGTGRFLTGRLGGLNGDGHGAVGLLAETACLIGWALAPESLRWAPWSG